MLGWRKTGVGKDLPSKKVRARWRLQDRLRVSRREGCGDGGTVPSNDFNEPVS